MPDHIKSFFASLVVLAASNLISPAKADCTDAYPGARSSPPPWAQNPSDPFWYNTCFIDFGSDPNVYREMLEQRCRSIEGFVQFNPDRGSGHNTCVFRSDGSRNSNMDNIEARGRSEQNSYSSDPAEQKTIAEEATKKGDQLYLQGWGALRSGQFDLAQIILQQSIDQHFIAQRISVSNQITLSPYGQEIPATNFVGAIQHSLCTKSIAYDFEQSARRLLTDASISHTLGLCKKWEQTGDVNAYYIERLKRMRTYDPARPIVRTYQAPAEVLAPNSCIEAINTHRVSAACDFKEGVEMFETSLRVANSNGCPNELRASYLTSYDRQQQRVVLDRKYQRLWTCGSGPINLRVVGIN